MVRHVRALVLSLVWLSALPARAGEPEGVDVGALVVKVDATRPRATIDKGKKAGLKLGTLGELFPMRVWDSEAPTIDFDVRLANGRVVELTDTTATIAFEGVAEPVEVGAYYRFHLPVADELSHAALFRVTALGIELRPQSQPTPFITLEAMLADPSPALRDKVLDSMIADIKDLRSLVVDSVPARIEEGRYHGKLVGEVIDALDRAQLLDFLAYVDSFPGKFVGHHFKMPEVFFMWVVHAGTESGEHDRALRFAHPTITSAEAAAKRGSLDEARTQWQAVLRAVPDDKDASDALASIDKILLLTRTVTADPDDTASRSKLTDELFALGAFELAVVQNEELHKRTYEPLKVDRMAAQLLARRLKWHEADLAFARLVKAHPDDKDLVNWSKYTHAHARVAASPADPSSHAELAAYDQESKGWGAALDEYRKVLDSKTASKAQRQTARLAQTRISVQRRVDQLLQWARDKIRKHDIPNVRDRIAVALHLIDKLGDASQAGALFGELAELARTASEEELALELFTRQVESVPDDRNAHTALAYALLGFDRIDEAEAAAKRSLDRKGDPGYGYLILSYVASVRDDLPEAEKLATKATVNGPKYAWPLLQLARAEAARNNWQEAINHSNRAVAIMDAAAIRATHAAAALGQQALEGLRANPTSARERLRLVRALAELGLARRTAEEIAKLPADGTWRTEGWWSLATSSDDHLLLRERLAAARNAKPATNARKQQLAVLEAQTQLRAHPKDDDARIALAKLYIKTDDYDGCLATLVPLMAQPMRPVVGDLVRDAREAIEVDAQLARGREALARHDLDGADRMALAYQAVRDRIGATGSQVSARELRIDVLVERGQYPQAIALAAEARALAATQGDPVTISILDRRIGGLRASIGTNDAQEKALEDGRKVCDDLDDQTCLYYLYLELVTIDQQEGRSASSIEHARTALNLADSLGRPDLARTARFRLADANLSANQFNTANELALALLVESRKAQDVTNEQYSLMLLGAVATTRSQGKIARARFQEVYGLGTRTGETNLRAIARKFEGEAWLDADHDPARAAVAFQQADELYKALGEGWATAVRGSVLRELADALLQTDKLAAARKAAEEGYALAQRFQRREGLAFSERILALVAIKEGKADDALVHARAAVTAADKTDDTGLTWAAYHVLARAEALKGLDQDAAAAYDKALDQVGRAMLAAGGESQRAGFMSTGHVRELYTDATELFLKLGNTKRAMEVLELSHDAVLKQALDPTQIQTKDAKVRSELDHYKQTRARVNGLQKQLGQAMDKPVAQRSDAQVKALGERIAKTRQELDHVVMDLQHDQPQRFAGLRDPDDLFDARKALPAGSVLVEYFVGDDALYAFVISAGLTQPAVVRVKVTSTQLEKTVAAYRTAVLAEQDKVKQRDKVETLGRQLDAWLLEPLRAHIDGATTVIILPFGPLFYVPFDALVVSPPGEPVRYAIEDFRISIQTAGTLKYLLGPARARAAGTMLAVSNPDGSLPGAQLEVNRIVKTAIPDAQVLGNTATVQKFRDLAGGFRYLHLATHGILDADSRKSFMKLADGPLTVEMIGALEGLYETNEMVVLSACDTAVEKGPSTGNALITIAGAFSRAGSPSLVASLWAVSDDSTAELMATFYRALELNTADRLEALRTAKLNILRMQRGKDRPFAAPWHWSAFQLYGDFRAPQAPATK